MSRYNAREVEPKWQRAWDEAGAFRAERDESRPKYYVLEMFPYPSGRIHMGHVRNYAMGDVVARYKRARGFNVLHPMGWDAFGLAAENAAMERGVHPKDWTYSNIATMRDQLKSMGLSLDWSRELATCDPEYSGHQQAMFLDMLEAGFVARRKSVVNWDPVDQTVLANEQVIDGRGWRSGALVERRERVQWVFRISDMADELLAAIDGLKDWPEKGPDHAGQLDRAVGGDAVPVPDRAERPGRSAGAGSLHDPARHAVRGELCGDVAGSSADPGAGGQGAGAGRLRGRMPADGNLGRGAGEGGEARFRHGAAGGAPLRP